jgi:hypothetical protein
MAPDSVCPRANRQNPGECFNAGFFRCLGYNFGICSKAKRRAGEISSPLGLLRFGFVFFYFFILFLISLYYAFIKFSCFSNTAFLPF